MSPIDRTRTPEARDLVHYGNETAKNGETDSEPTSATYPTLCHVRSLIRRNVREST